MKCVKLEQLQLAEDLELRDQLVGFKSTVT